MGNNMKYCGLLLGVGAATIFCCLSAQAAEPMSAAQLDTVRAGSDPIPGVDVKLGHNPGGLSVSIHPGTGVQVTIGSKLSVSVGPNGYSINENGCCFRPPHPHS